MSLENRMAIERAFGKHVALRNARAEHASSLTMARAALYWNDDRAEHARQMAKAAAAREKVIVFKIVVASDPLCRHFAA